MPKKPTPDPITGHIKQPLANILILIPIAYGVFAVVAFWAPDFSIDFFRLALLFWFIGVVSFAWLNYKPNLWSRFLSLFALVGLFTIIAIRIFSYLLPQFSIISQIIIITANTLPMWNTELTQFIRGELSYNPSTSIGKLILKYSLMLLPIAGGLGASLGMFSNRFNHTIDFRLIILGPLCWFLAIILPFSFRHPISPWEHKKLKARTNLNQTSKEV